MIRPNRLGRARFGLFFLLATALWLPCVQLFYSVDAAKRTAITSAQAEHQIAAWAAPPAQRDDLRRMRGVNPEWDFMSRTFTVLGLAELSLAPEIDSAERSRLLRTIDTIIDDTIAADTAHGETHFLLAYAKRAPFVDTEARSIFIDGEIVMMIAARQLLARRDDLVSEAETRAKHIERAMRKSPSLSAESYPDECWTFCNTTALAGLLMLDRTTGQDHGELARAWLAHARTHLVDPKTGILVSSYTYDGRVLDGPEGSSIWMSAQNLLFVDEDFARDQYARARRELGATFLGFAWAREWPRGVPAQPDIDSGPIVPLLDASAGASGLAVLGASAFGDSGYRDGLLAALELAAFPIDRGRDRRYLASNAVGDAVLLRALTFGPLLTLFHDRAVFSAKAAAR